VIRNGPFYFPRDQLSFIAEAFSRVGPGELLTYGNPARFDVDRFHVRCLRLNFYKRHYPLFAAIVMARIAWHRLIKRRRIVVITYDPLRNGLIGVTARYLFGAKLVCELNGVFDSEAVLMDKPNREGAARLRRRMLSVGRWVLRRCDHIKLLYARQADAFIPRPETPRSVFFDIYNEALFTETEPHSNKVLLFVGHPLLLKGVDVLLEAFALTRHEFPEWRLTLVGWRLEDGIRRLELPCDGVDVRGPMPQDELAQTMARSEGLILPSRSEGMGRVLLEAAASARARLGSRIDGIPTYIEDGKDGLLFNPDDIGDLTRVLTAFFSDQELRHTLGRGARARYEKEYRSEHYSSKYGDLVDSLRRSSSESFFT